MSELIEVHLIGLPLALQELASERYDELMREFADLAATDSAAHRHVPGRLLRLEAELRERFSKFGEGPAAKVGDAIVRGDRELDLVFEMPPDVANGAAELLRLLNEADEYCAAGDHLLTLESPPEARAYRSWFLTQFVDQAAGRPPVPWTEWLVANPIAPGLRA